MTSNTISFAQITRIFKLGLRLGCYGADENRVSIEILLIMWLYTPHYRFSFYIPCYKTVTLWQWGRTHNRGSPKLKELHGIHLSLILRFYICAFPTTACQNVFFERSLLHEVPKRYNVSYFQNLSDLDLTRTQMQKDRKNPRTRQPSPWQNLLNPTAHEYSSFNAGAFSIGYFLSGRDKRENYGKGRLDPNAVNSGGKDRENKRRALIRPLQKKNNCRQNQGKKAK